VFKSVALMSAISILIGGGLTACSAGDAGQLGALHDVAKTCPKGKTIAAFIAVSASGNQRVAQLTSARMAAVKAVAQSVAVCGGGNLKVVAFGPSLAASVTVYDKPLAVSNVATLNARLLRVPRLVNNAMAEIENNLTAAFRQLSPTGTDPLGQLNAASDFAVEQGEGVQTAVLIESAGMGPEVNTKNLTPTTAIRLADAADAPSLPGAQLIFAGLGHVGSGPPPSTTTVEGLVSFYRRVCQRTGAVVCRATSDITVGV
jgi:hypothetical protein